MKTLIFGAGGIGSFIGGSLAKGGFDVVLIGRKEHVDKINQDGLSIDGDVVRVKAFDLLDDEKYGLVVIATKAYDTEKAVKILAEKIDSSVPVLSIQNGLMNEEIISTKFDNVVGGVTSNGVVFEGPGKIRHNSRGKVILGMYKGIDVSRDVCDMLMESGLDCEVSSDIRTDLFGKFVVNCGLNALATIADVKNGVVLEDKNLYDIFLRLIEEAREYGYEKGFTVPEVSDVVEIVRSVSENTNSMLQDVRNGKSTEIEQLNGLVGKPYNEFLVRMVRFIGSRFQSSSS